MPDGVFIAYGDAIQNVRLTDISVLDIAPTVLALYNAELPASMDGKVLTECIKPQILRTLNVTEKQGVLMPSHETDDSGHMNEMKEMLESLGYM